MEIAGKFAGPVFLGARHEDLAKRLARVTVSGAGELLPGFVWRFQLWYRDIAGGQGGFNLSDALAVTVGP